MKKIFAILATVVLMLTILVSSMSADGGGKISMREGNTTKISEGSTAKISEGSTAKIDRAMPSITVTKEVRNKTMGWNKIIAIVKQVDNKVQFKSTIQNDGSGDLTNIVVTDTLSDSFNYTWLTAIPAPSGVVNNTDGTTTITWTLAGPLAEWATETFQINATVEKCGIDTNTLTATAEGGVPLVSVSDEDTATVNAPPLGVANDALLGNKTVWNATTEVWSWKDDIKVNVSDVVRFMLTIENNVTCDATNLTNIVVTDTLPAGLEYTSASPVPDVTSGPDGTTVLTWSSLGPLVPDAIETFLVNATVKGCGDLTNTHNATAMCCGVSVYNETNAIVRVQKVAGLTVTKTVKNETGAWVNEITVNKNDTVLFQLKIRNNDTCCNLTNINISDQLPPDFDFISATSGWIKDGQYYNWTEAGTLVFGDTSTYEITAKATECGVYVNNASANASACAGECSGVTEVPREYDNATVTVTGVPGIIVTKTVKNETGAWVNETTANVSDNMWFRSRINNSGVCVTLTSIEVTDILSDSFTFVNATPTPDGKVNNTDGTTTLTWHVADLEAGQNQTLNINATTTKCGVDTNTLNAAAVCGGATLSGEATATVNVRGTPVIEVNKKAWNWAKAAWEDDITADVNDDVRFQLEIHNNGTCCDLTYINVTDILSDSLKYISATPEPPYRSCNPDGTTTLKWFLTGPLAPCETETFLINATVTKCGDDINTLNATARGCDDNVSDEDIVHVRAVLADLVISEKSETIVGELFNITYTVSNIGCLEAVASNTNISIDGVLSDIVSTPVIPKGGNYTKTVGPYNCPGGAILNVRVCADCNDTVYESHETNNCKENEVVCPGKPDLVISEKSETIVGDELFNITYTVANIGSADAGPTNTTIQIDTWTPIEVPTPAIAKGGNYTKTLGPYNCTCGENLTIRVCADNGDVIVESNETNNCKENELECLGMCGDVNCDGNVTMSDVRKVFNREQDPNYPLVLPWAADVNCDGSVTMSDVRKVFNREQDPAYDLHCC